MPGPTTRPVPARIREVLADDAMTEVEPAVGGVERLRPVGLEQPVLVLRDCSADRPAVADEIERLLWLAGRSGAPELLVPPGTDDSVGLAVVAMPVGAVPASRAEHGVDPATVALKVGALLRAIHELPSAGAPTAPALETLRDEARDRAARQAVTARPEGPYRSQSLDRLVETLDSILDELGPSAPLMIHGRPTLDNLWITPDASVSMTGWGSGGVGCAHRDLAVASGSLADTWGPATIAPFLDAYGLDAVDLRRLDAHQLLDHLLT